MPVAGTPVSERPDASFIGGILLAGMVPSPTMSETLQLAEVAEYEHLFVTGDPTDVDLIETGIVAGGALLAVAGVASVNITVFQRQGLPETSGLADGFLVMNRLEIARLENDPNFPERGIFTLELGGGR
jgi:hypothetical protein